MTFPKPTSRLAQRTARLRDDRLAEAAFKRAVWTRDEGTCRICGCRCLRTLALHPRRGEVHHVKPRAYRATRFDVRNGLLLCAADHERVTRHQMELYATGVFIVNGVSYQDFSGVIMARFT